MNTTYEGKYIVNSFHAVDADTGLTITPDTKGFIELTTGQKVVFQNLYGDGTVDVNTLIFFAGEDGPLKVQINDNNMYPFYVEAGGRRGITNMRVYSFTALADCELYYEGIVC